MPAVSEFTKATLHQRGMAYGQISTNLGLSKGSITAISTYYLLLRDGCGTIHAIMRKWEDTGTVVRRPGSGRRRVSSVEQNEAPPNYHRNLCLSMRNRLLLAVKFFFYFKLLILSLINKCYNLLALWIDLYFEFFDICVPKYNLLGRSVLT
jgi:hypothetical protein